MRVPGDCGTWKWLILMIQKSPHMAAMPGWREHSNVDAKVLDGQIAEEQVEALSSSYMSPSDAGSNTGR